MGKKADSSQRERPRALAGWRSWAAVPRRSEERGLSTLAPAPAVSDPGRTLGTSLVPVESASLLVALMGHDRTQYILLGRRSEMVYNYGSAWCVRFALLSAALL